MQRSTIITLVAGVVAGLATGRLIAPDAPGPATPVRDIRSTHEIRTVGAPSHGIDRAALRAEIRAALAETGPGAGAAADGAADADGTDQPPPEPTPEERAAADTGRALFDTAISRGRWRDEDGDRLRAAMDAMPAADREALIVEFVSAINSRRIVSDRPIIL